MEKLYAIKYFEEWDITDVNDWLSERLNLPQYKDKFSKD